MTLPPEVIEAQLRHLAAATALALGRYHSEVAASQDRLLEASGLGPESLALGEAELEQQLKAKMGQIQEDT